MSFKQRITDSEQWVIEEGFSLMHGLYLILAVGLSIGFILIYWWIPQNHQLFCHKLRLNERLCTWIKTYPFHATETPFVLSDTQPFQYDVVRGSDDKRYDIVVHTASGAPSLRLWSVGIESQAAEEVALLNQQLIEPEREVNYKKSSDWSELMSMMMFSLMCLVGFGHFIYPASQSVVSIWDKSRKMVTIHHRYGFGLVVTEHVYPFSQLQRVDTHRCLGKSGYTLSLVLSNGDDIELNVLPVKDPGRLEKQLDSLIGVKQPVVLQASEQDKVIQTQEKRWEVD